MHWIKFEDRILNLEQVTHFAIKTYTPLTSDEIRWQIRAYFTFGYGANSYAGTDHSQESINITNRNTKEECETIVKDIIAGNYDMKQQPLWITGEVGTVPQ